MSEALSKNATPREIFLGFLSAIENRDGETSWNLLSKSSQELFGAMFALMDGFADAFVDTAKEAFGAEEPKEGCDPIPELGDGKTMWVNLITKGKQEEMPANNMKDMTIKSEEVGDTEAHLMVTDKDGKEDKVDFIKEDGVWKLFLAGPGGQS
jgi:hypothetical protein